MTNLEIEENLEEPEKEKMFIKEENDNEYSSDEFFEKIDCDNILLKSENSDLSQRFHSEYLPEETEKLEVPNEIVIKVEKDDSFEDTHEYSTETGKKNII